MDNRGIQVLSTSRDGQDRSQGKDMEIGYHKEQNPRGQKLSLTFSTNRLYYKHQQPTKEKTHEALHRPLLRSNHS